MTSVSAKEQNQIRKAIHLGGSWLGACRLFLQSRVNGGDRVTWGSEEPLTMTMKQIEELALEVAVAAIGEDRVDCDRRNPVQQGKSPSYESDGIRCCNECDEPIGKHAEWCKYKPEQKFVGDPRIGFSLPFVHWSKDPLIPYDKCECSSCSEARGVTVTQTETTG